LICYNPAVPKSCQKASLSDKPVIAENLLLKVAFRLAVILLLRFIGGLIRARV